MMPILDHFNILAPYYERFIPLGDVEELIDVLDLPVHGALLDAGGGTGRVAKALKGLASEIVVADYSLGMLNQASGAGGLHAVNSGTERLPFMEHTFERVMMIDALHHVHDQRQTAGELWRVLKPGGRIVIKEPDVRKFSAKLVALGEKIALMRSHFMAPPRIAGLFPGELASIQIRSGGFNAWIIIEKKRA
jgi:ubiquinone/menaquinone biosynthesis C-methylase UbiE